MEYDTKIRVDYLARTEGETAITIELKDKPAIELKIFEPPRFFEGFLVGRKFDEVGDIVSRICGICPVSHMTTAIYAIEKAMGIKVSPQTKVLRNLMSSSQIVASHLIHLYMLAMPDYYGQNSVVGLLPEFGKEIARLMKMKEILNGLTGLIGGRALHPVTHLPGGFTKVPTDAELKKYLKELNGIVKDAKAVVLDVSRFKVPEFYFEAEYAAIDKEGEYAINDGRIISSKGLDISVAGYLDHFEETQINYAFTKQSRIKGRGGLTTGALPRMNLKFKRLHPETKALAKEIGFKVPNHNPYLNNLAQALEVYDGILHCIDLLSSTTFKDEECSFKIKAGEGAAITEAPRGLLYHWYKINNAGVVEKANLVTPTSHNFLNIEDSLKKLVQENLNKPREEILFLTETLVRAYDPCFSCSVH